MNEEQSPRVTILSAARGDPLPILGLDDAMDLFEKWYLRQVLLFTQGRRDQAARLLAINRRTLYTKIKKYGLE